MLTFEGVTIFNKNKKFQKNRKIYLINVSKKIVYVTVLFLNITFKI